MSGIAPNSSDAPKPLRQRWALIVGDYINAYSIVESLRRCSWPGRIVCLRTTPEAGLMDLFGLGVEVWRIPDNSPNDLIPWLAQRVPHGDEKVVFFTNEAYHEAFVAAAGDLWLARARFSVGSARHLATILDRHVFYQFVTEHGLGESPRTIPGEQNPWRTFPNGFCVRARRSWHAGRKLPRVQMVANRRQAEAAIAVLRQAGLEQSDWCYQEILSVSPRHNVSVCGWFDAQSPLCLTTRKVFQHPPRVGNGDVCEVCNLSPDLLETTARLLIALAYEGPFELEFVLDLRDGRYKIIELNPRFWMQHGLIEAITGDALVRRYAGLPAPPPEAARPVKYWVNTVYGLFRIGRCDLRVLRYFASPAALLVPEMGLACRWIPHVVRRQISRLASKGDVRGRVSR